MKVTPIHTRICQPPKDDLTDIYTSILPLLSQRCIVAVSSKIIAIEEGRCVRAEEVEDKDALIAASSDLYLPREYTPGGWVLHTITQSTLIPSAGIDESNADGHYILWPSDSNASAERICRYLREKSGIDSIGVVVTDSHSVPMRRGVVGIAIGYWGFEPLLDYRGQSDLFGRQLKVSQANLPDGFAATAVLAMGEGSEQTPVVLLEDISASVAFIDDVYQSEKPYSSYLVALEDDLYYPFVGSVPWERGGDDVRGS